MFAYIFEKQTDNGKLMEDRSLDSVEKEFGYNKQPPQGTISFESVTFIGTSFWQQFNQVLTISSMDNLANCWAWMSTAIWLDSPPSNGGTATNSFSSENIDPNIAAKLCCPKLHQCAWTSLMNGSW